MRNKTAFFWILLPLILTACPPAETEIAPTEPEPFLFEIKPDPQVAEEGREVYNANCAACHGVDGIGQNPENPRARDENGRFVAPPHNQDGHTWHHDDDLLIQIIKEGGMGDAENFNEMPAFGEQLSDDEINAVLIYIKTLWTAEQRERQRQVTKAVRARE